MFARLAFVLVAMPCLAFAADAGGGAAKPPQPTAAKVEQGHHGAGAGVADNADRPD